MANRENSIWGKGLNAELNDVGVLSRPLFPANVHTPAKESDCYGTQLHSSLENCLHFKSDSA